MSAATAGPATAARTRTRPVMIMRALADSPVPLSTPELVALLDEGITPGQRALSWYGQILRRMVTRDRVTRAGDVPGGHRRPPAHAWAITAQGRAWLAANEDAGPGARAAAADMLPWARSRAIGRAAAELREKQGRRQRDVAGEAGFCQSALSFYERGASRIPATRARDLARALGTTVEALAAEGGADA